MKRCLWCFYNILGFCHTIVFIWTVLQKIISIHFCTTIFTFNLSSINSCTLRFCFFCAGLLNVIIFNSSCASLLREISIKLEMYLSKHQNYDSIQWTHNSPSVIVGLQTSVNITNLPLKSSLSRPNIQNRIEFDEIIGLKLASRLSTMQKLALACFYICNHCIC